MKKNETKISVLSNGPGISLEDDMLYVMTQHPDSSFVISTWTETDDKTGPLKGLAVHPISHETAYGLREGYELDNYIPWNKNVEKYVADNGWYKFDIWIICCGLPE